MAYTCSNVGSAEAADISQSSVSMVSQYGRLSSGESEAIHSNRLLEVQHRCDSEEFPDWKCVRMQCMQMQMGPHAMRQQRIDSNQNNNLHNGFMMNRTSDGTTGPSVGGPVGGIVSNGLNMQMVPCGMQQQAQWMPPNGQMMPAGVSGSGATGMMPMNNMMPMNCIPMTVNQNGETVPGMPHQGYMNQGTSQSVMQVCMMPASMFPGCVIGAQDANSQGFPCQHFP